MNEIKIILHIPHMESSKILDRIIKSIKKVGFVLIKEVHVKVIEDEKNEQ